MRSGAWAADSSRSSPALAHKRSVPPNFACSLRASTASRRGKNNSTSVSAHKPTLTGVATPYHKPKATTHNHTGAIR